MEESKQAEQIGFGDFLVHALTIVLRYRRFLSRFIVIVTTVSIILALVLPKWYLASVSVFPAEDTQLPTSIEGLGLFSKAFSASKVLTSLSGNPDLDRYVVILKSSSVLGAVIQKFDLVHVYEITSYPSEKTSKELLSNTDFTIESEGNLLISVFDKDPQRAADMANFFVSELSRVNASLKVQNARGNREFIQQRYDKNLRDLAEAEDSLKAFQKRTGILALKEQTEASLKAITEFSAQIALRDVQTAILARTLSEDHPLVEQARAEAQELRKKLDQMNDGVFYRQGETKVLVPFNKFPDLGIEYFRRYRDVEIQAKILQFLTPVFEQAKVEENRQTPAVVILDKAVPPERKAKPKVTIFALVGFVLSTLIGLFVAFLLEAVSRLRAAYPAFFVSLNSAVQKDWFGLRPQRERGDHRE